MILDPRMRYISISCHIRIQACYWNVMSQFEKNLKAEDDKIWALLRIIWAMNQTLK